MVGHRRAGGLGDSVDGMGPIGPKLPATSRSSVMRHRDSPAMSIATHVHPLARSASRVSANCGPATSTTRVRSSRARPGRVNCWATWRFMALGVMALLRCQMMRCHMCHPIGVALMALWCQKGVLALVALLALLMVSDSISHRWGSCRFAQLSPVPGGLGETSSPLLRTPLLPVFASPLL